MNKVLTPVLTGRLTPPRGWLMLSVGRVTFSVLDALHDKKYLGTDAFREPVSEAKRDQNIFIQSSGIRHVASPLPPTLTTSSFSVFGMAEELKISCTALSILMSSTIHPLSSLSYSNAFANPISALLLWVTRQVSSINLHLIPFRITYQHLVPPRDSQHLEPSSCRHCRNWYRTLH